MSEGNSDMFLFFAHPSSSPALQLLLIFLSWFYNRSRWMEWNRTSLDAREIMKWVWSSSENWILKYYLLSLHVIQFHFTTLHVNKYVHLFLQLQDISYYFSTAGCLFSLFFRSALHLLSLLRFDVNITTHCVCFVSHSSAYVVLGPGPPGEQRCYRLNPSSKKRSGDVWR